VTKARQFEALRVQLGGTAPDGLRKLSAEQLADLADAIAQARHREAAAIAQASEQALSHIPRVLRGPVRRVVR
jgi:predicted DNA-binding transcriptional regulator YafY